MLAIVGGSGLTRMPELGEARREEAGTPYGPPSGPLVRGRLGAREVLFLARHGEDHGIAPHEINYRANLWALREAGATEVLSIATVGSIPLRLAPGSLAVPHQLIDYTWGRAGTFSQGAGVPVRHIDFTEPYSAPLRARLLAAAARAGERVADGAVYAVTQGPRLETAAEITRLERDGADVVGMTAMPEAALARELDLAYAALAVVVNYAAGRGDSSSAISLEQIGAVMERAIARVRRVLVAFCAA